MTTENKNTVNNVEVNKPQHQFNSPEDAAKLREKNELDLLNRTLENKDKNMRKSIIFGILSLFGLVLATCLVCLSIFTWGWWAEEAFCRDWFGGGLFVGLCLAPAIIFMGLQWVSMLPLMRLIGWKKEGRYDYEFTKRDKAVVVFGIITYVLYVIVRLTLRLLILLIKE